MSEAGSGQRRWLARLTVGAVVAGAIGFALKVLSVQTYVCTLPPQPFVSDMCGAVALGERPTRDARIAYAALPTGDCSALQAFRDTFEDSPLRANADSRLNAKTMVSEERWVAGERRLALFAGGDNEAEARVRSERRAEQLCKGFAATTSFRLKSATVVGAYACDGGTCGVTGEAVCGLEERHVVTQEACGSGQ